MIQNSFSVGIHIRRGDFVSLGLALPAEYYLMACKEIAEGVPNVYFFVFTDDISWCKANEKALGLNLVPRMVYVTGNNHGKNYIDMQLMSMCKALIMSNSSFCYFAALMNQNLALCINPTPREV